MGSITKTIDLTAIVKAKYSFSMTSDNGRLSMNATAGDANHYTLDLSNSGSVALTNISFTSTQPDEWTVTFNPKTVDTLSPGQTKQVDVVVTPPSGKTIAGDYYHPAGQ